MLIFHSFKASGSTFSLLHQRLLKSFKEAAISRSQRRHQTSDKNRLICQMVVIIVHHLYKNIYSIVIEHLFYLSVTVYFTYMLLKYKAQLMIIINSHSKRSRIIICINDKNDYNIRTRLQGCIYGWSMCICYM